MTQPATPAQQQASHSIIDDGGEWEQRGKKTPQRQEKQGGCGVSLMCATVWCTLKAELGMQTRSLQIRKLMPDAECADHPHHKKRDAREAVAGRSACPRHTTRKMALKPHRNWLERYFCAHVHGKGLPLLAIQSCEVCQARAGVSGNQTLAHPTLGGGKRAFGPAPPHLAPFTAKQ